MFRSVAAELVSFVERSFSTNSRPALRPGGDTGVTGVPASPSTRWYEPTPDQPHDLRSWGETEGLRSSPPGRLNVLLRAIPAGRALVMEPALACPTTTPPKPRPHRLDPVQHARPPLTPTVLHARPNNKKSTKT